MRTKTWNQKFYESAIEQKLIEDAGRNEFLISYLSG
jgi:hypothetical protein